MPRSGSSLLENILSKDASIKSSAESATLFSTLRRFSKISGETPITLLEPDALARHRDQLLRCHAEILQLYQIDTERFIDKSMENFLDVGRILMLYPNAKIIHLNRNPLDVCMSCYQFCLKMARAMNIFTRSLRPPDKSLTSMTAWQDGQRFFQTQFCR